ncbi:hypothetical protein ONZ45_g10088 [Pleurotus djamor]|nr:hypothetical protein ONZ45_g10088 [Pleurotus djamor]
MAARFPVELWVQVIANHDSPDRRSLLPLQLTSKLLYSLVTPVVYGTVLITFSGAAEFTEWLRILAAADGREPQRVKYRLSWDPPTPNTTFPHISIPFHQLSRLRTIFTSNPKLATYTTSLVLEPFHEMVREASEWRTAEMPCWAELRNILVFFTNVHRVSGFSKSFCPPSLLRCLPQLKHMEVVRTAGSVKDFLLLLRLNPTIQFIGISSLILDPRPVFNNTLDTPINLPALVSLETGPDLLPLLSRHLSASSWHTLRHLSFTCAPTLIPPIPILNHLLSLQVTSGAPAVVAQLFQHLTDAIYISVTAPRRSHNFIDIDAFFVIPSPSLNYLCLASYLPLSVFKSPSPTALFEKFPKLVIMDMHEVSDDGGSSVNRFLCGQTSPVDATLGSLPPFQSWWERAREEVQHATMEQ